MRLIFVVLLIFAAVGLSQDATPPPAPAGITVAAIEARITELQQQKDQAIANVNALAGAIQDCQFWLEQAKEAEKPKEVAK